MEVCGDGIETTRSSAYKDQKTAEGWKTKTYHKDVTRHWIEICLWVSSEFYFPYMHKNLRT